MSDQKQWHYIHQKMSQDLKRRINAFCSEKISKHKPSCERVEGRIAGDIGFSPPPFFIIRYNLMEMCWQEIPVLRPDFVNISKRLRSFIEGEVSNKTFSKCYFSLSFSIFFPFFFFFFFFHAPCIKTDIFAKALFGASSVFLETDINTTYVWDILVEPCWARPFI